MDKRIEGTYCPLCGAMALYEGKRGDEIVRYCLGDGSLTPETSHTAYVVGKVEKRHRTQSADQEGGK